MGLWDELLPKVFVLVEVRGERVVWVCLFILTLLSLSHTLYMFITFLRLRIITIKRLRGINPL